MGSNIETFPLNSQTRVTGRHLNLLSEHFNAFEIQLVTGIFQGEISRLTSAKNIDKPISDAACCFVIRTLLEHPEWAPLPKLNSHSDLVEKLGQLLEKFPLPTTHTFSGVYIGKSSATSYALNRGSAEMSAISIWITIFLRHFDDFKKEGKNHFIYKMMEEEAHSRNLNGLQSIVLNKGWPKKNPEENETGIFVERITGKDIKVLQKDEKYGFDHIQIQHLLGAFMSYISTQTNSKNINLPLADATRSLIIRYLKQYPENAPLPELYGFEEFCEKITELNGQLPVPCNFSKLGVILGRGLTTVNALASGDRRNMPVLAVWSTMILNHIDEIIKLGYEHPIMSAMKDEALSRGLTMNDIVLHGGWPKKNPIED